jgi:hypothetical protein
VRVSCIPAGRLRLRLRVGQTLQYELLLTALPPPSSSRIRPCVRRVNAQAAGRVISPIGQDEAWKARFEF